MGRGASLQDIAHKSGKKIISLVEVKNDKIDTEIVIPTVFPKDKKQNDKDEQHWREKIQEGKTKDLKRYIELYPKGLYTELALSKIRKNMKMKQLYLVLIIGVAIFILMNLGLEKA